MYTGYIVTREGWQNCEKLCRYAIAGVLSNNYL